MALSDRVIAAPVKPDVAGAGVTQRLCRFALLAITDICALFLAVAVAYFLWALPMKAQSAGLYMELVPLVLLFVLGYAQAGLYPGFGLGPVETFKRLCYVTGFGFIVLAAFSFALKLPHLYSRVTFVLAFAFSLVLVPLTRVAISYAASRWQWWREPVVVVGTGQRAIRAIEAISEKRRLGYRPAAVLSLTRQPITNVSGVPVAGGLDEAGSLAARGIRVALLELDQSANREALDRLQQSFRHVVLLREYDDLPVEGLQVRNLGDLVGIEYTNNLLLHGNRVAKRALDLVVGSLALLAAAPIILCAAILVRLLDGAPVFFFQDRAGLNGRRVAVPKIRTMKRDAEKHLEDYLTANPALREEWQTRFKLTRDPRIIPVVGRVIRRFSLDELPQLWSVVAGHMSLVGPRPLPDYHTRRFSPAFVELRERVRPGITGLWQISVRSEGGIAEQQAYDTYYIHNWSVWLDLYVLCRTVGAVASGRGAY